MFKDSKYTKWYFQIISDAVLRNSGDELHHIIPKSLGGLDKPRNLVSLTFREHFIVHLLLTKMPVEAAHRWKMYFALTCFMTRGTKVIGNRRFEQCKRISKKIPRQPWNKGIPHSAVTKEKLRLINLGKKQSLETIQKRKASMRATFDSGLYTPNPLPSEVLRERYFALNCGKKMAEGRKSSLRWRESVSTPESREKRMINSPKRKIVIIDGVEYPSIRSAARILKEPYSKIRQKSLHPPQLNLQPSSNLQSEA